MACVMSSWCRSRAPASWEGLHAQPLGSSCEFVGRKGRTPKSSPLCLGSSGELGPSRPQDLSWKKRKKRWCFFPPQILMDLFVLYINMLKTVLLCLFLYFCLVSPPSNMASSLPLFYEKFEPKYLSLPIGSIRNQRVDIASSHSSYLEDHPTTCKWLITTVSLLPPRVDLTTNGLVYPLNSPLY